MVGACCWGWGFGHRGRAWGRGVGSGRGVGLNWLFPHYRKIPPFYSLPRLLSCSCIVHSLYSLLVCVCAWCASGFVGSGDRGGRVVCAGCGGRVCQWGAWWGRGKKWKNSGGGCDHERKSSTPHMSDLNRAALGYPTPEYFAP